MDNNSVHKGTVLIVEDTVRLLDANRRLLEEEGCRVFIAQNIARAREILSAHTVNAVVLDIMLPDGDGLKDLFPEIKETYNIPVLFLTARTAQKNVNAALSAGGFDYMKKPYDEREFRLRVMRMLGVSRNDRLREFTLKHRLTPAELKIARLVAEGLINKQIADKLNLSEFRIKTCLTGIYKKLEINGSDNGKRQTLIETLINNCAGGGEPRPYNM